MSKTKSPFALCLRHRWMPYTFFIALCYFLTFNSFSQGIAINATGGEPNNSAMLDVSGPSQGVLINRMTTTERDAITTPIPESLLIFNTTTKCLEFYVNGAWQTISCGCTNAPTAVTAFASLTSPCENSTIMLTGIASGATSWSWTGPNGFTSTLQSPAISNITTAGAGVYTLTASNICGAATAVNTATVTVNSNLPVSIGIAATATTICTGTSVTFTATPTNGGTSPSYQWKLNNSDVGTNSPTFTTTSLANSDKMKCIITSNATCATASPATSNEITMTVNPNLPASISIAASATTICSGTSVTFTATPTNGGTTPAYLWKLNNADIGTNSTTFTTTSLANSDKVKCVLTSNATCATGSPATSNEITMTVNPNLTASVSIAASPSGAICSGTSVTFTATPTNGGSSPSYQWKLNNADVGTNATTNTTTSLANSDKVKCIMTSNATCATGSPATSNEITMTVNPNLPASVSIAATATTICSGTSVTFTATPTNGGTPTYQWKVNGSNAGTNSNIYTSTTLANNDAITCVMTSNATPCLTSSPATSNSIIMKVNTLMCNLIAYWKLDENSGDASDASGNGYTGTNNNVTYTTGKKNNCGSFNGSNGIINIPYNASLAPAQITYSYWIKTTFSSARSYVISQWANNVLGDWGGVGIQSSTNLYYFLLIGSTQYEITPTGSVTDGNWHHIVLTYNGSAIKFYKDNVEIDSRSATGSLNFMANKPTKIGCRPSGDYLFNGLIDEVSIWNRALTTTEISALYNSGGGIQYPF